MSQRNFQNERYSEENAGSGSTRKSAASAKPKAKAAASVTVKSAKKTPQQRKAEQKAAQKAARDEQRRLDRKYYNPDTDRYKFLRRLWWGCLIGAIAATAVSWVTREIEPGWISMAFMIIAYALIIAAFYIDFSKIRKERMAFQDRMLKLEAEQAKAEKAAARAARQAAGKQKGSGKNASRNPKAIEKAKAEKDAADAEAPEAAEAPEVAEEKPAKKGLFGFGKKKAEEAAPAEKAAE